MDGSYPIVQSGTFPPGKCIITGDIDGPFFDFGDRIIVDPRLYIHVPVIKQLARELDMVDREDVEALQERFDAQTAELEEIKRMLDAIQTIKKAEEVFA